MLTKTQVIRDRIEADPVGSLTAMIERIDEAFAAYPVTRPLRVRPARPRRPRPTA